MITTLTRIYLESNAMTEITTQVAYRKNVSTDINPMPLWQALFFFGLPALLFRIFSYQGIPTFVRLGLTPLEAYIAGWTIPAAILFAAMLVGAREP